jgi:O-antigen biosynthesis protein
MFDISIIIVNYNVRDILDTCIASIYQSNASRFKIEIFVVDNNSIDGSVDLIKNKYPEVNLISNDVNLGFSKANNIALKKVQGKYVLILNPDTVLEEGTFDKLISFCESNNSIGAVTSKLLRANGKLDSACKRSFPTLSVALPRILGLSKIFPKSKLFGKYNLSYLDENKTYEVDAVCGAFMFIPKFVFDKVGLFDEDYFMYGEDLDLCYRIKKIGLKIFYYPDVKTIHLKGESTRKTNLSYVNNFYGAMTLFVRKNISKGYSLLNVSLQIGIFLRSFFSYLYRIVKILALPLIDIAFLYGSFILSVKIRFNIFPNEQYVFIITTYILVWIFIFSLFKLYTKKYRLSLTRMFNAIIVGFFVNSSFTYFFKEYAYSRGVILVSTIILLFSLLLYRGLINLYKFFVSRNIIMNKVNLLIIGEKKLNQNIEEKLLSKYNIVYFNKSGNYNLSQVVDLIRIKNIKEVVFSADYFSNQDILNTMWSLKDSNTVFKIVPTANELILSKLHSNINNLNFIEIEYNINNKMNIFLKRIFDISLAFVLLLTVYPFLILFKNFIKTKLSRHTAKLLFLPKVLSGKYSFVGIPDWFENNGREYLGKPGLTGLIQLNYYKDITDEDMMNFNIYYAKNQSLALDMEILLKTLFSFLRKK